MSVGLSLRVYIQPPAPFPKLANWVLAHRAQTGGAVSGRNIFPEDHLDFIQKWSVVVRAVVSHWTR